MIASPRLELRAQLGDRLLGDLAGRDHHPRRAAQRRRSRRGSRRRRRPPCEGGDRVRADVIDHALVAVAHQAPDEVGAHPSSPTMPSCTGRILARAPANSLRSNVTAATDTLVVFGISGDLAKKMTFEALYQLERRGDLGCRIVGVAIDDWDDETLASTRARRSRHRARPRPEGGRQRVRAHDLRRRRLHQGRDLRTASPPSATATTRSSTSRSRRRCSPRSFAASAPPG